VVLATVACSRRRSAGVVEGNGSGWSYGRVERVFGGAIGGGAQGGVAGVLKSRGKATEKTNFGGGWWWSAVRFKERKRKLRPSEALSTRRNSGCG
jgi:hypothetical protein